MSRQEAFYAGMHDARLVQEWGLPAEHRDRARIEPAFRDYVEGLARGLWQVEADRCAPLTAQNS